MSALLQPIERRTISGRRALDRTITPLNTFERQPKAHDADGNGMVAAFVLGAWTAESWRFVAEHRMSAPYWMPLSALPVPGE